MTRASLGKCHDETALHQCRLGRQGERDCCRGKGFGDVAQCASGSTSGVAGRNAGVNSGVAGHWPSYGKSHATRSAMSTCGVGQARGGAGWSTPRADNARRRARISVAVGKVCRRGIPAVSPLRAVLLQKQGRRVAATMVYRRLARHGWRKVAPDTRPPKRDSDAGCAFASAGLAPRIAQS